MGALLPFSGGRARHGYEFLSYKRYSGLNPQKPKERIGILTVKRGNDTYRATVRLPTTPTDFSTPQSIGYLVEPIQRLTGLDFRVIELGVAQTSRKAVVGLPRYGGGGPQTEAIIQVEMNGYTRIGFYSGTDGEETVIKAIFDALNRVGVKLPQELPVERIEGI